MLLTPTPRADEPPKPAAGTTGTIGWHELYAGNGQEAAFAFLVQAALEQPRAFVHRLIAAFVIAVQVNCTSLVCTPADRNRGIMFAGEIGVGGPISFIFAIFSDLPLNVARSQSASASGRRSSSRCH